MSARRCLLALVTAPLASLVPLSLQAISCGGRTGLLDPTGDVSDQADASRSIPSLDAGEDALAPVELAAPRDVVSQCPDAGSTLVYTITTAGGVMSFFPPTGSFATIGHVNCPAGSGAKPFSMAVDRAGIAYVLFDDGELFRVSTATATCRATAFVSGQQGFSPTFGMGFSADPQGTGETLYVASDQASGGPSPPSQSRLAWIDTKTYALHVVGTFSQGVNLAELTGTGAGDLFAFYPRGAGVGSADSFVGQIDKTTAQVVRQSLLSGVAQGTGWAFAFWGGDFYTFTAPPTAQGATVVTRFRPSDGSIVQVARSSEMVVGAGVSTCAPQQ